MFAFTSFRGELGPGLEPVGTRFELAGSVTGGLFGLDVRQAGEAGDAAVAVEHDRDAVTVLEGRVLVQLDGRSGASVAAVPVVELPGSDLHGLRQDCCVGPTSCHFISPCQVDFAYETNLAHRTRLSRVCVTFAGKVFRRFSPPGASPNARAGVQGPARCHATIWRIPTDRRATSFSLLEAIVA